MKLLNQTLVELTHLLSDGNCHNGDTLGEKLNITRSAVWKAIKKLQQYGVKITAIKNQGYQLTEPLILLNKKEISKNLTKKIELEIFESIDSTNLYLKKFFGTNYPRVCLAEQQTAGKGRLTRNWHSPFAENIYLSCYYFFKKDISALSGLSLLVGLIIAKVLRTYQVSHPIQVKWPNDIIVDHKKIAGILIELQAESHGMCSAIIGIGINVNMLQDKQKKIQQPWASLRQLTQTYIDRNALSVTLINELLLALNKFEQESFASFLPDWHAVDYLLGKSITLQSLQHKTIGKVKGVDQHGHLLLQLTDGSTRPFSSGDTTILKDQYHEIS